MGSWSSQILYTRAPIAPGAIIRVRPIGVLKTIDGGEQDDKILAVPVSKLDPTYDAIKDLDDLPEIERQRVEAFFRVYKELPEGRKVVELEGFGDRAEALTIIQDALRAYQATLQRHAQAASTMP